MRSRIKSPQYITIRDVAEIYGINERTVRRYIAAGKLRGYRIGPRNIRLVADEVAADLLGVSVGGVR